MPLFGTPGERIGYTVYPHPRGAPPLFLFHGFTASAASFMSNLAALRERFTVITVDLLGHGESDSPAASEPYGPGPAVERIIDLFDHLEYDRVLICGHSLGGALAMRVALDYPDRVAGLVVINSNSAAGSTEWRNAVQPQLAAMAGRLRREGTFFLRDTRLYPARSNRLPPDAKAQLTHDFDRLTPEGVAGTAQSLVGGVNAFERLPELTTPTLIVVGDRDPDFVHNAPRLVAGIRNAPVKMVTLLGAGHAANLEQPAAFEQSLFEFAESIGYIQVKKGRNWTAIAIVAVAMIAGWAALVAIGLWLFGPAGADPGVVSQPTKVNDFATAVTRATALAVGDVKTAPPKETATAASPSATASVTGTATAPAGTPSPPPTQPATAATPGQQVLQPTPTPTPTGTPTATSAPPTATTAPATPTPAGPGVTASGPASAAIGETVQFVATYSGSPTLYAWSAPTGKVTGMRDTTFSTSFASPGCHVATFTAAYPGNVTKSASVSVSVGGVPCN
ncbi:MAG: alpha/beta fold hydrolase [Chloroflexi bacterium]|nr:alpha/beta fold hydrolase [Chloroflexota bacterium]